MYRYSTHINHESQHFAGSDMERNSVCHCQKFQSILLSFVFVLATWQHPSLFVNPTDKYGQQLLLFLEAVLKYIAAALHFKMFQTYWDGNLKLENRQQVALYFFNRNNCGHLRPRSIGIGIITKMEIYVTKRIFLNRFAIAFLNNILKTQENPHGA